jgi:hypothetical protein
MNHAQNYSDQKGKGTRAHGSSHFTIGNIANLNLSSQKEYVLSIESNASHGSRLSGLVTAIEVRRREHMLL